MIRNLKIKAVMRSILFDVSVILTIISVIAAGAASFDTDFSFYRSGDFKLIKIESGFLIIVFAEVSKKFLVFLRISFKFFDKVVIAEFAEEVFLAFSHDCSQRSVYQIVVHKNFGKSRNFLFDQCILQFNCCS